MSSTARADYLRFLESKAVLDRPTGMESIQPLPKALKPFQTAIVQWALRRGRAALFEGTGLGKTLQQLSWARAVADYEDGPLLILTPLAVAQQTVDEASKFGIHGVAYAEDRGAITTDIVVTNYERFEKFDIGRFCGIVLDESGIIKSHDGATRTLLTDACRRLAWKLPCSATPAPNDYAELGQHAEFLGVMTAKEMLSMFFVHDGSIRANDDSAGSDGWRLKRHAENDFWRWLASWAIVVRHPSDLGFDDADYDLPPLNLHQVTVDAEYRPVAGQLFPFMASTLQERIGVRRDTADTRVAAAVEIINREPNESWLIWCNLNAEADAIEAALPVSLQVAGRHSAEIKVERLLGFKSGKPPILVSKPSLAGHGMNWQHCARCIFVGLTDSFEQVYQAIRRVWRFGQFRAVDCYFVASELEGNVVANIRRKEAAFNRMQFAMATHMRDVMQEQVLGRRTRDPYEPRMRMELPRWL
jgi:hypothetical protein